MFEDLKPWIEIAAGIISLYFLIYRPMSDNATSLKINTESNKRLQKSVDQISDEIKDLKAKHQEDKEEIIKAQNDEHQRLWRHESKQDQQLENHDTRIGNLESQIQVREKQ